MTLDPDVATGNVVAVNVASDAPAGIVTLAGTVARVVTELMSVTTAPPVGAGPFKTIVAVAPHPPMTLV